MALPNVNPSPEPKPDPSHQQQRIQLIVDFWQLLYLGEDAGETTWEELGTLQAQVTDAQEFHGVIIGLTSEFEP